MSLFLLENFLNIFGSHNLLVTPPPSHPPASRKACGVERAIACKPFSPLHQLTHQKQRAVRGLTSSLTWKLAVFSGEVTGAWVNGSISLSGEILACLGTN